MTGKEFSSLRKQLGYTVDELAYILDVSRVTIWRIESGRTAMTHLYALGIGTVLPKEVPCEERYADYQNWAGSRESNP